jgi:hypothetical protein
MLPVLKNYISRCRKKLNKKFEGRRDLISLVNLHVHLNNLCAFRQVLQETNVFYNLREKIIF